MNHQSETIKLSISSGAAGGKSSPEQAVEQLSKAGFRYAELGYEHGVQLIEKGASKWREFKQFAEQNGVFFQQAHMPYIEEDIACADDAKRAFFVARHKRYIQMCSGLGITAAVLHIGGYHDRKAGVDPKLIFQRRLESLRELLQTMPENMDLCLENLPPDTFQDIDETMRSLGYPENLGYCLDTGHLHLSKEPDIASFIRKAGKRLKALHIHDNVGPLFQGDALYVQWYFSDKHMWPGYFYGSVDWQSVVIALNEIGYQRLWNFEIMQDLSFEIPQNGFRELVLKQNLEKMQKIFLYDYFAPPPGEKANDFSNQNPIHKEGLKISFEQWHIKVAGDHYSLKVDPVHGGRIFAWQLNHQDLFKPNFMQSWGIPAIWQPSTMASILKFSMTLETMTETPTQVNFTFSSLLNNAKESLRELSLKVTQSFERGSFATDVQFENTSDQTVKPFAPRFQSMLPCFQTAKNAVPQVYFNSINKPLQQFDMEQLYCFGEVLPLIDETFQGSKIKINELLSKIIIQFPEQEYELHITFPNEAPCALYAFGNAGQMQTLEPIFALVTLAGKQKYQYSMKVQVIALR